MIGFIIKKSFFDSWDNLLKIFVFNLVTLPFLALAYYGLYILSFNTYLGVVLVFLSAVFLLMHIGTIAYFFRDIGNNLSPSFSSYFKYLKTDISVKIKFSVSWAIFILITSFSIFYYFSKFLEATSIQLILPLAVVFWFSVMSSIAVLLFYPIKIRLEGDFRKVLKKCFIIMFDNPFTTLFIFLYALILLIISIPTLGLIPPGVSGITCLIDTTVHILELKYDYLENNPDADRKKIPWLELTYELNENIGPRSIKGMIFPWKD